MAVKKIKLPNNTTVDINDARDVVIGDGVENVVALTTAEYEELSTKDPNTAYVITDDTEVAENVANKVTSISSLSTDTQYPSAKLLYDKLAQKQELLTFDSTPTSASTNPVTSGGVYTAFADKQATLTFDSTPTSASTNPVTSGGVYTEMVARPKYYLCASESEYEGIATKDSATLYLIPKT